MWHYCFIIAIVAATVSDPDSHPRLIALMNAQPDLDRANANYFPNPYTITENTPLGTFTLKALIHSGKYTAVFTVAETKQFVIKYQSNCAWIDEIHPVLKDAWFTNMANELGLAPKVRFVSPPICISPEATHKFDFNMNRSRWDRCYQNGSTVRFMVIDRILGEPLFTYHNRYDPRGILMHEAVEYVSALLSHVESLHNAGIVHGDIHSGNVMVSQSEDGDPRVHIIDFGLASFVDQIMPNEIIFSQGHFVHKLATPWQLQGYAYGKRDDVYKVIDLLASLINGRNYEEHIKQLENIGNFALKNWRTTQFIFEMPLWTILERHTPFTEENLGVDKKSCDLIREKFVEILDLLLEMKDINVDPPYEALQSLLMEVYELAATEELQNEIDTSEQSFAGLFR